MPKPRLVILAGPNGAGKTTVAKYVLPEGYGINEFVNADQIAVGLSAFAPESVAFEAGRIMLKRIDSLIEQRASFAFETTLASRTIANIIESARQVGYEVVLLYIALPTATQAKRRVASRVKAGGHTIAPEVIERRFYRSVANLIYRYRTLVDSWFVYDNSYMGSPKLIAFGFDVVENVLEERKWRRLKTLAKRNQP